MKVLKFGGTSVGTAASLRNVKSIVENQTEPCVVVVSALGGLTDRLILTARHACAREADWPELMEGMAQRHRDVIAEVIPQERRQRVLDAVEPLLDELSTLYRAISLLGELTERTMDLIVSYGERMSCQIVSNLIDDARLAMSLDFVRTRRRFDKHVLDSERTSELLRDTFAPLSDAKVVVAPGFISTDDKGQITNLGRGGSDYTAAIIAAELGASVLEIWTDVDGFMTADPRQVPDARVIDRLSFVEAMELCNFGAKVVYPPTIYPVFHKNIPIIIKNTFRPEAPGTVIFDTVQSDDAMPVKGVTSMADTCLITVSGEVADKSSRIYNSLAREGVGVFLSTQDGTFGVRGADAAAAVRLLNDEFAAELTSGVISGIEAVPSLATLAIVGRNLREMTDAPTRLLQSLDATRIPVLSSPRDDSDTTVACMVPMDCVRDALRAVHNEFFRN